MARKLLKLMRLDDTSFTQASAQVDEVGWHVVHAGIYTVAKHYIYRKDFIFCFYRCSY